MSMVTQLNAADVNPFGESVYISEEIYNEVKAQLVRKMMTYIPGIPMDPMLAIDLYGNSINGIERIRKAHTKQDGSSNNNPVNFGNVYEEQEVTAFNLEQILQGSSLRAERTDNLADQKKAGETLPPGLDSYAVKHHGHVDIVIYDEKTGEVVETLQVKHTRGSNILAREQYTTHEDAPDAIMVPTDMLKRHIEKLISISNHAHSDENRENAKEALKKLKVYEEKTEGCVEIKININGKEEARWVKPDSNLDSMWTENPDKDNHPWLHAVASKSRTVAKSIPYIHQGCVMGKDAVIRVGGRLAMDGAAIIMGGVLYEMKDAYINPGKMTFLDRLERIVFTLFARMKDLIKGKGLRELSLELVNGLLGLLGAMFGNVKALLKLCASSLQQIWDKVWDYVNGKIKSFSDLVSAIFKGVSALAISTCAIAVEEYLAMAFAWVPRIVIGLLAAAAAGLAIVFSNKIIDQAILVLVNMASEAEAARIHREQVEAFIEVELPKILEETDSIEAWGKDGIAFTQSIHESSYSELQKLFQGNSEIFRLELNRHARAFGANTISDDYLTDLDRELNEFAKRNMAINLAECLR